jgi:hypothetical protein
LHDSLVFAAADELCVVSIGSRSRRCRSAAGRMRAFSANAFERDKRGIHF